MLNKSLPNLHATVKDAKDGWGPRQHSQVLSYRPGALSQTLLTYSFVDLKYIEKLANEVKVKIEEVDLGNKEIGKEGRGGRRMEETAQ